MIMYSDTCTQKEWIITRHLTLIVMISVFLFNIVGSKWTVLAFNFPITYSRFFTATLYLLLSLFMVAKFVRDISRKRFSKFSLVFYGFIFYCICVVMIRLMCGEEAKYTVYWTIIMGGSISIASLIFSCSRKNKISLETTINDFVNFGIIVAAFKALYVFYLYKTISYDPININKECCIMLVLIPCAMMGHMIYGRKKNVIATLLFSIIVVFSGSRGALFFYVFEVALMCLLLIKHGYKTHKILLAFVLSVIVLGGLIVFNVGNIQRFLLRALMLYDSSSTSANIIDQVSKSDAGRIELYELGYNEFLKSPLIGTGTVYFNQVIEGLGEFNQSCHNFILETLDCFGLLGLGLLSLLFAATFKMLPKHNSCTTYLIIISVAFFGYALVQPLLYDPLAFLTYCIAAMICVIAGNCTNTRKMCFLKNNGENK